MLPSVVKNKIEQIWRDVIAGGVSQPTEVIDVYKRQLLTLLKYFRLRRQWNWQNPVRFRSIRLPSGRQFQDR